VVKSGDPVEQEKQLKYASLVANTVMLSNVADLTEAICAMATDRHPVTADLVACISPISANISAPSAGSPSIWQTCRSRSIRSRCHSKSPCDHFLHHVGAVRERGPVPRDSAFEHKDNKVVNRPPLF